MKWKPYLATSLSRTPVIHHSSDDSHKHPLLIDYDKKDHANNQLVPLNTAEYPLGKYIFVAK